MVHFETCFEEVSEQRIGVRRSIAERRAGAFRLNLSTEHYHYIALSV